MLGLPPGTVRSRIARGRAKLAALLDGTDLAPGNRTAADGRLSSGRTMTDPSHTPQPDRPPRRSTPTRTVAGLRAMLRDEPVDDDELARERRIRAALAAAPVTSGSEPSHDAPSVVPIPRRSARPARCWSRRRSLAVLGIGGYVVVSGAGSGSSNDSAEVATADQDTLASSTVPGAADSAASAAPEAAGAPTTTVGTTGSATDLAPPRGRRPGPVRRPRHAARRRWARRGGPAVGAERHRADRRTSCPVSNSNWRPASMWSGSPRSVAVRVVVVTAPTGTEVLDAATCAAGCLIPATTAQMVAPSEHAALGSASHDRQQRHRRDRPRPTSCCRPVPARRDLLPSRVRDRTGPIRSPG